jgi:hypothetical protein
MDEVGWERGRIFRFVDRLVVEVVSRVQRLKNSLNHGRGRDVFIGLDAG